MNLIYKLKSFIIIFIFTLTEETKKYTIKIKFKWIVKFEIEKNNSQSE
jgi:hypothetical protein